MLTAVSKEADLSQKKQAVCEDFGTQSEFLWGSKTAHKFLESFICNTYTILY